MHSRCRLQPGFTWTPWAGFVLCCFVFLFFHSETSLDHSTMLLSLYLIFSVFLLQFYFAVSVSSSFTSRCMWHVPSLFFFYFIISPLLFQFFEFAVTATRLPQMFHIQSFESPPSPFSWEAFNVKHLQEVMGFIDSATLIWLQIISE